MATSVSRARAKLFIALAAASLSTNALASTCVWTGASGALWSMPLNWSSCGGGAGGEWRTIYG